MLYFANFETTPRRLSLLLLNQSQLHPFRFQ